MSKQSNQLLTQLQSYLQSQLGPSLSAAETESPYLTSLGKDSNAYMNFLKGKGEQPAGYNINLDPLARQVQQSGYQDAPYSYGTTATSNERPGGALLLNRQGMTDRTAAADAANTQGQTDQYRGGAVNTLFGLGQADQNRRQAAADRVTSLTGGYFNAINNRRPSFLHSLIQGAVQSAPGIIAAL